eukprot:116780_1
MEATFESAPQILISTAFLVKSSISSANNPIIIISLITSFWSVSARVSGDDKLMFKDEWKSLECSSRFPFVNCRYIIRVLWRFLEISSRIILLCLMWIDLGGLSVFIVLTAELIYLSVICFGLQSIGVMGNIIYLVAAYSNKKSEQWAISMTRLYWSYRVLSSYLYLMLVTVFAMGKFDEPKINDHRTRHAQTIENKVGLAIFVYCWIVTPIWQWIGAVIVFDYGNISSVGRDLDQLLEDGKLLDVLELISFGAKFNATTLTEVIHILKKPNSSYNHTVCDQIVDMCLVQLQQQQKVKDLLFNAAYDGNSEIVECVLNATDLTANVQDDQKRTPLFYAAAQQHNELVATLLMVYSASCSILIDDHASEQPMNILQYKLANTEFPCDEDDDLAIIRMLVELGKVEIDINTYNLAKTSHHSSAVLEYLNDLGDLKQDECEHIQHDITVLKKCKMKPKQLAKAKWTKDRDRRETFKMEGNQTHAEAKWIMQKQPDVFYHDDRPILDCTLKICRYLRVINFIILIAAIFGSDIAALVINSAHDCNGALLNGSAFVSFDVNDFILGGSITHLVVLVLILCGNGMCGNEIMARYTTRIICCFLCWLTSWSVIGFLMYSEMDQSIFSHKQCAAAILSWSIISLIQILGLFIITLCLFNYHGYCDILTLFGDGRHIMELMIGDTETQQILVCIQELMIGESPFVILILVILIFLTFIAAMFGSDVTILVINSVNGCNEALPNGSAFVSFDVNGFILGGSITHLVGSIMMIAINHDKAINHAICTYTGCSCCFLCWLISWSIIGFLMYSEMDNSISSHKQCADGILSWSIISLIQTVIILWWMKERVGVSNKTQPELQERLL